ncbi:MAG: acetolactate synthase small subunit [Dehalococcoidia bacterium]|nr:acetolactate synthase small subunit [Dehalococcoidia bacterium]HRC61815.1 acetolactate synthase small subunit [Dehalococcoidia bacterium]
MKHTVIALVEDRPGVLNRCASLFRRRGFNIDSLAVGTTEEPGISRMTIVVEDEGAPGIVEQVEKQLYKLIDVIDVANLTSAEAVMRELALVKVRCTSAQRREVLDLIDIFRGHVVDVSPAHLTAEIVAAEDRMTAFIENLRPYGILELVRTGRIAMMRGPQTNVVHELEPDSVLRFHTESGRRPEGELPYVSD